MIKAVFFDVDGTLLSFNTHRMPDSTRRSLDRLRDKGILTFVATGRHISQTDALGGWRPDGYVTLNGSYCMLGGEVVHKRSIDPGDVSALIDRLENGSFHPFIFVGENATWINYADDRVREMLRIVDIGMPETAAPSTLRGTEIFQLIGFFGEEDEREVMRILPDCHATRWTELFADIVPRGTDKWEGITKILERSGLAREEVMVFGDGGNDIGMLRGAGTGVAMGNAAAHVREAADYVTASVDDDGIEKALEHYGII